MQNEMLNDAIKNNSADLKELQENSIPLNNKITRENKTYQKAENELNVEEYFNKGYKALITGNYDLVIQYYNKAIDIDPNNASTYNNLGSAYNKKQNFDLAIQYLNLQKCLRQKDDNLALLFCISFKIDKKISLSPHLTDFQIFVYTYKKDNVYLFFLW